MPHFTWSNHPSATCTLPDAYELTAKILGFQEHDIPVLVSHGQLEPLGKPIPNARKYFARVKIMEIADDPSWLSKATKLIYQHWQGKNASRKSNGANTESSHSE
jgi:hypothetical protein